MTDLSGSSPSEAFVRSTMPARLATGLFLTAVVSIVLWPLGVFDWWAGYESIRYQLRLDALATNLLAQGTHPRWIPETAGGFGTPYFNFYAPGFTYLCLPFLFLGTHLAVKAAIVLVTAVGTWSVYSLGRIWNGRLGGCVAALLFTTCPYLLFCLYVRCALAEYAALHMGAAVLWMFWKLCRAGASWRGVIIAAGAYSCWFTLHNVSSLFLSLMFAWVAGAFAWQQGLPRMALVRIGLVFPIAAVLSAWFWLPALTELPLVQHQVLRSGIFNPLNNLNNGLAFLLRPSRSEASFGPWLALVLATCLIAAFARRVPRTPVLLLCVPACAMLVLTFSIAAPIWNHVPLISFIQFPWRLTGGASLLVALTASYASTMPGPSRAGRDGSPPDGRRRWAVLLGATAFLGCLWALSLGSIAPEIIRPRELRLSYWDRDRGVLHPSGDVLTAGEFLPSTSDYTSTPAFRGEQRREGEFANIPVTRNGVRYDLVVAPNMEGTLVLKQYWWTCWRAEIDGVEAQCVPGPGGCIAVPIQKRDATQAVSIFAARTPVETFSEWSSGLAWLAILATLVMLTLRARNQRAAGAGS